jgi:hypothetical protein
MVAAIETHRDGRPVALFHGSPLLYAATGATPPSPLTFPEHLINPLERNVSLIDTDAEIDRILAKHPGVVVWPDHFERIPQTDKLRATNAWLTRKCTVVWRGSLSAPREAVLPDLIYACPR